MGVFGDLVRELRNGLGWSQDKLAQAAGLTKTRISQIEQMNTPEVYGSTEVKLAAAFGLSLPAFRKAYEMRQQARRLVIEVDMETPKESVIAGDVQPGLEKIYATALEALAKQLRKQWEQRHHVKERGNG
jgi:transcriptional regulator with XRE-family HTH domain